LHRSFAPGAAKYFANLEKSKQHTREYKEQ